MKIFTSASGYTFAFGVANGQTNIRAISWNDPATESFMAKTDNEAGWLIAPCPIGADPAVVERADGVICVGETIELYHCGKPFVWGLRLAVPAGDW
jgi:hypothetical protein